MKRSTRRRVGLVGIWSMIGGALLFALALLAHSIGVHYVLGPLAFVVLFFYFIWLADT